MREDAQGQRAHVVLMLLASGPAPRSVLARDTGWGVQETNALLDEMLLGGEIAPYPDHGNNQRGGRLLCLPAVRAQVLEQRHLEDTRKNTARVRRGREQGRYQGALHG